MPFMTLFYLNVYLLEYKFKYLRYNYNLKSHSAITCVNAHEIVVVLI